MSSQVGEQAVERRNSVSGARPTSIRPTTTTASSIDSIGKLTVGSRCIIADAADIRGNVHIGDGTIIHPTAFIQCVNENGKIVIGKDCIIEERVHIFHQGEGEMKIGDKNLFEVGARIESSTIGSHNTFECRSRVTDSVIIQDFTTVGAGCIAQPPPDWIPATVDQGDEQGPPPKHPAYTFPSQTVIYGDQSTARIWSGNGVRQADALYAKHQEHLRRSIPKEFKLKIIR
ncbi:uncharacterized protein FA14DRAFT_22031 [Meira miltonrushii]|uniref:Dynactin subunit 6 n=1 Tax=Meira miltonrushii TaxID=1280837 RepID=A0A316VLQ1_9BASI|nr:uncharacterized protein FA14DRAFT_22031 [Meira miltonrushii]PWN38008.1 hypothetical protein FA14DRAFT_22031 [Meira miltonrushii]